MMIRNNNFYLPGLPWKIARIHTCHIFKRVHELLWQVFSSYTASVEKLLWIFEILPQCLRNINAFNFLCYLAQYSFPWLSRTFYEWGDRLDDIDFRIDCLLVTQLIWLINIITDRTEVYMRNKELLFSLCRLCLGQ